MCWSRLCVTLSKRTLHVPLGSCKSMPLSCHTCLSVSISFKYLLWDSVSKCWKKIIAVASLLLQSTEYAWKVILFNFTYLKTSICQPWWVLQIIRFLLQKFKTFPFFPTGQVRPLRGVWTRTSTFRTPPVQSPLRWPASDSPALQSGTFLADTRVLCTQMCQCIWLLLSLLHPALSVNDTAITNPGQLLTGQSVIYAGMEMSVTCSSGMCCDAGCVCITVRLYFGVETTMYLRDFVSIIVYVCVSVCVRDRNFRENDGKMLLNNNKSKVIITEWKGFGIFIIHAECLFVCGCYSHKSAV